MSDHNSKPRSATDLLPKCRECAEPERWERVPSGWVRRCGHGGIVTNRGSRIQVEKEFKAQVPVAIRTNWAWTNGRESRLAFLINGGLWSLAFLNLTDVWASPAENELYAALRGSVRTFLRIEEPLPEVAAKETT